MCVGVYPHLDKIPCTRQKRERVQFMVKAASFVCMTLATALYILMTLGIATGALHLTASQSPSPVESPQNYGIPFSTTPEHCHRYQQKS